jgi:hypothetical protein
MTTQADTEERALPESPVIKQLFPKGIAYIVEDEDWMTLQAQLAKDAEDGGWQAEDMVNYVEANGVDTLAHRTVWVYESAAQALEHEGTFSDISIEEIDSVEGYCLSSVSIQQAIDGNHVSEADIEKMLQDINARAVEINPSVHDLVIDEGYGRVLLIERLPPLIPDLSDLLDLTKWKSEHVLAVFEIWKNVNPHHAGSYLRKYIHRFTWNTTNPVNPLNGLDIHMQKRARTAILTDFATVDPTEFVQFTLWLMSELPRALQQEDRDRMAKLQSMTEKARKSRHKQLREQWDYFGMLEAFQESIDMYNTWIIESKEKLRECEALADKTLAEWEAEGTSLPQYKYEEAQRSLEHWRPFYRKRIAKSLDSIADEEQKRAEYIAKNSHKAELSV